MFRIICKGTLILLAVNLLSAQSVLAQDCERAKRKIQRLDRDLQRVAELAHSFDSERALELVRQAHEKRDRAVEQGLAGKCRRALVLIDAAFSDLEAAAKLILAVPIRRLRSQVEELFRRAEDLVAHCHSKQAIRVLERARRNRDEAEHNLDAKRIESAVEHFRVAKELSQRVIELCQDSQDSEMDRIQEAKRKFETLKERALDVFEKCPNPAARRIYQQALETVRDAEEKWHQGRKEVAKRLFNHSILLLLRAMDLACGNSPGLVKQAEVALFRVRELLETAREANAQSQNPRARLLIERAHRFISEAEAAIQEGRSNEALWKIGLAENMLRKAQRFAQGKTGRRMENRVVRQIENTRSDLAEIRAQVSPNASRDAQVLVRMAQFALNKAEQAADAGFQRVALEGVLASQRFLARAERILTAREKDSATREQVQLRLSQLDAAISDSESRVLESAQDWNMRLLQNAKEIRKMAYESLQKGNFKAANTGIQVSFELLRKSVRNVPRN
ncbi:MAG: hypothetical protein ACE5IY_01965 [bacterium]